jgi:hypothetical protein
LIEVKSSDEARRAFAENYEWRRILEYAEDELFVRQPKSIEEIVHEGKVLSHCVGGYADRHAKGQTHILFLRRRSEPDKPYYTIEVSVSGKISQCYGYRNNSAGNFKPAEISEFEKRYQQYLTEVMNERIKSELQQSA